jgi:hypothetical protein
VIVAMGAAWWAWRRRRVVGPDPCAEAERRLRALQDGGFPDPGAAVAAAWELVRECIAARLEAAAATRTTDELLASPVLALNFSELEMASLRAGLRFADGVKFGGAGVTDERARAAVAEAIGLVRSLAAMVVVRPASHQFASGAGLTAGRALA